MDARTSHNVAEFAGSDEDRRIELLNMRQAAWEKMQAGKGQLVFVTATGMNGKNTSISPTATCEEVFNMAHEAIQMMGNYHTVSEADFSRNWER